MLASVFLLFAGIAGNASAQVVSITGGAPPTESFDSLLATGTGNSLPSGWLIAEKIRSVDVTYLADNGASPTGNTFSYGATGSSERALGALLSGSVTPTLGAQLQNNTGSPLNDLLVEYTGEQWRVGTLARADRLDFQYSLNAISIVDADATWVDVDALDFNAPTSTGAIGPLDGNAAANRTAISAVVTGLNLAPGASFFVRFSDFNATGADDGLAIDDARIGVAGDFPPVVSSTLPGDTATGVALASNLQVIFSEPVTTASGAFTLTCANSGSHSLVASGSGNTRVLDPDNDFTFNELCTATVVAALVTDLDGTIDTMVSNQVWSFQTLVDVAPTVLTTAPAANATGVAVSSNIVISFSEPVTTSGPWLDLQCNGFGYLGSSTPSAGGMVWTFDPTATPLPGEACTVTVVAANVTDLDGAIDPMAANLVFGFSLAPDLPPTVTSSFPQNLDVNIAAASNLTVVFSEPVTLAAGALTISCSLSGDHSYALSNNAQINYTLDPAIDFTLSEDCTLDVIGALVTDLDGVSDAMVGNQQVRFSIGAGLAAYYDRVDSSSCRALRATLHGVIDDHTAYFYSNGSPNTWAILEIADQDPLDSSRVLDIYQNCSYAKVADRVGGAGAGATCVNTTTTRTGVRYNREHSWPNSHGFGGVQETGVFPNNLPNAPYTDTHMLFASDEHWNSDRGNKPYANCPQASGCTADETTAYTGQGGGPVSYPGHHNWFSAALDSFEPFDARKGDVARAQMYMAVRYDGGVNTQNGQPEPDLILTDSRSLITSTTGAGFKPMGYMGLLTDLLAWHAGDPVTAAEVLRNNVIESFQGNRNPLVDHPEWASVLFTEPCAGPLLVAVDDDFALTEDSVLNRPTPGALSDDHQFSAPPLPALTATLLTPALHGSASLNADGSFSYAPVADYCGKDSFVYTAADTSGSDQGVVHLDIACVNDLPTAVGTLADVTADAGSLLQIPTAAAFSDADGDLLVYSVSSTPTLPTSLSIDPVSGELGGTPLLADAGVYTVSVRASEPAPLTGLVTQTFTLTLNGISVLLFQSGFE